MLLLEVFSKTTAGLRTAEMYALLPTELECKAEVGLETVSA